MKMLFKHNSHKAILTGIIAIALLAFSACSSDDNETDGSIHQGGLRVSIPAVMDSGTRAVTIGQTATTTTFVTTDVVYVYNATKGSMDASTLQPNVDGANVNLEGTLTGAYDPGDRLRLYYNMNSVNTSTPASSSFSYTGQAGTSASAGANDFAQATATVATINAGVLETTGTATFTNLQSIFRLSFSFADWNNAAIATAPTITSLVISSPLSSIAQSYAPLAASGSQYTCGDITLTSPAMSGDVYFAFPFDESKSNQYDALEFTATASNGLVYKGEKDAPLAGFQNGGYYHSSTPVVLKTAKIITLGIINYFEDRANYYVHFWGGTDGTKDAKFVSLGTTESKALGSGYWDNAEQTFYMFKAEVPHDITGFKIWHDNNGNGIPESWHDDNGNGINDPGEEDNWFGEYDGDASLHSKVYIFNYSGDKAIYE